MLVDGELYLPHDWTRSRARLDRGHVPKEIGFRTKIEIAQELHERVAPRIPHGWTVGDDEFGRPAAFRRRLRRRGERYVLEVPSNTAIRDLDAPPKKRRAGRRGPQPQPALVAAHEWAKSRPAEAWTGVFVRDGEKGPQQLQVITARVRARTERRESQRELLVVTRTLGPKPEYKYFLSNAEATTPLDVLAQVATHQHRIEEAFLVAKDDLGMDHYEVRSWIGWHHHMTMIFLGQWFLTREHRRLGGKSTGLDRLLDGASGAEAVAS